MTLLAGLALAAPARAADPIMPLSEVRAGMRCTSLSVVQGLEPVSFDVEVLDVVEGDPSSDGPRILIQVSGPAVDRTGIGPGFSGSPIYCQDGQGRQANIGAISESVGEYGGKVALATPIESILGNPPDVPGRAVSRRSVMRRARDLSSPLTVSGLSRPVASALARASARHGHPVLAAPSGPLRRFPPQALRPGSSVGVGYSSGDITLGAIGTVAYVDGDRVWSFGHELDAAGRRSLLLQDAYVYRVIDNPNQLGELGSTYKLAAASHDVGTLSNDALTAVVGRLGVLPKVTPVQVTVRDLDTRARQDVAVNVADETDVGNPLGTSLLGLVGPLAVVQGASGILKSVPGKLSGDACTSIVVRELGSKPLRFCNRYVGDGGGGSGDEGLANVVASGAGADIEVALDLIGAYTPRALHVTSVRTGVRLRRGAAIAYLRDLRLPRRVRAGERVRSRVTLQRLHGPKVSRRVALKIPGDLDRGSHRIILSGTDADASDGGFFDELTLDLGGDDSGSSRDGSALDAGPQSPADLRDAVRSLQRFDGVSLFADRARGEGRPVFVDPAVRISGRVSARVRVTR